MTDLVRKRDGRLQSYREDKLVRAFLAAAGPRWSADDRQSLAAELARSISYFLFRRSSGRLGRARHIADSADIEAAAIRALSETGHPDVARSFEERARWRERRRGELRLPAEAGPTLIEAEGESPWSKSIVSSILDKEAGLDGERGAEIARSVEARIFTAGLPRISIAVLREFIEAELLARGLEGGLTRGSDGGAEPESFERSLDHGAAQDPAGFRDELGDERLRAYLVDEVLAGSPATALRQGALAFLGLERPLRLLAFKPRLNTQETEHRPFLSALSDTLRASRRRCSGPIILDLDAIPSSVFADKERRWFLDLLLRGAGELILRSTSPDESLLSAPLWLDGEADDTSGPAFATQGGGAPPRYWMLGFDDDEAVGEVCLLNLARCAFRAGRGERDAFLAELRSSVLVAAQGLARLHSFLETRVLKPDLPLWQPEAAAAEPSLRGSQLRYGIIPVGLDVALRYLTGEGIAENTRVEELTIEVLRSLRRFVREAGKDEGLRLQVFDDDRRGAALASDLARADRAAFAEAEELIDRERGYLSGLPRPERLRRRLARALGLRSCRARESQAPQLRSGSGASS